MKQSHDRLLTSQRKIKQQITSNLRARAQPTIRHQQSFVVQKTNLLNDSQLPLNEEEGSPSAKAAVRSQMFSESPFGHPNQSFSLEQTNRLISGENNRSGMINESDIAKQTSNSGVTNNTAAGMVKSPVSPVLNRQLSIMSRASAASKVSRFSRVVEARMQRQEHKLARAITFRDNIKDKDLKFVVNANLRNDGDDSNSNVSSFLQESKLSKFEMTLDVLYRVVN